MVRGAGEKFSAFFWAILYILSQLGKTYAYFYQWGKKYAFSPLFSSPFQSFFLANMLFGHIFALPGGGGQTEKYKPLPTLFHTWNICGSTWSWPSCDSPSKIGLLIKKKMVDWEKYCRKQAKTLKKDRKLWRKLGFKKTKKCVNILRMRGFEAS